MIKQFLCIFIVNYNTIFDLKKFKKKRIRKIILSIFGFITNNTKESES